MVEPPETFLYYLMLFIFAFLISAAFYDAPLLVGAVVGAMVFTLIKSAWYYVAYLTYNPLISSCVLPPTYNCTIRGVSQAVYFHLGGYPVTAVTFFEGIVHALLFFAAFLVWRYLLSD